MKRSQTGNNEIEISASKRHKKNDDLKQQLHETNVKELPRGISTNKRKPDHGVVLWRQPYIDLVASTCFDKISELADMVMDHLIPIFVTMPDECYRYDDKNIIDVPRGRKDRPVVYRIATLGLIRDPISATCGFRRINIELVSQPFNVSAFDLPRPPPIFWGSDMCNVPCEKIQLLDNPKGYNSIEGQEIRAKKPDECYQTRIIFVILHEEHCRDECCNSPTRYWNYCGSPLESIPIPLPSKIDHQLLDNDKWALAQRCYPACKESGSTSLIQIID